MCSRSLMTVRSIVEFERVGAERVRRHLAVKNLAGDVGIIGRNLPPALIAGVGRHAHEANVFVGEGFEPGNLHERDYPSCNGCKLRSILDKTADQFRN